MRISSRTKAVALLLLVSLQHCFAATPVDAEICSTGLCYPRVTGATVGKVKKSCPETYELSTGPDGKEVCSRISLKPCPAGSELKDGKCCSPDRIELQCVDKPEAGCPANTTAQKDCSVATSNHGRRLQADNPLFKQVNIVATRYVPNVILPKPAFSLNIAPPPKREQPKINLPSLQVPQVILPEPPVTFTVPKIPKFTPDFKFEGNPNFLPNIVPILPEPPITIEMPKSGFPDRFPKINTDFKQKVLNIDLSKVGSPHTVDLNVPYIPDLKREVLRLPDIDVEMPKGPAVIDLTHLNPKKQYNVTLPTLKLPKMGSLTIVNNGSNEPQYLDLTALSPHNKTTYNIKLPEFKTDGATLNIVIPDKNHSDIVVPGKGNLHHTVINVPDHEWPQKKSSLKLRVTASDELIDHFHNKDHLKTNMTKVPIKLPDIDLSHLPNKPDVVVDIKPMIKLQAALDKMPKVPKSTTKVNISMKDIVIPRLKQDQNITLDNPVFDALADMIESKKKAFSNFPTVNTTETVINLPNSTIKKLPIPAGKTDINIAMPINLPLLPRKNHTKADASISFSYQEEWSGGNPILPTPHTTVANVVSNAINSVTSATCPTRCCANANVGGCKEMDFDTETVDVVYSCEAGCTYDAKAGQCLCGGSAPGAATCPDGLTKCSLGGKGVCVPALDNKVGEEVCNVLKATCASVGIVAKSCS